MNKKNNSEITIITAYFDIGRGKYSNQYTRGNNKYIEYFKFWARIQNNLVIYTQKEFEKEIYEIREKFGLKNKTKVIVVDNIYNILPEMYQKMKEIEQDKIFFRNYRYIKDCPENKADYCYIMFLKTWCMLDAAKKGYAKSKYLAWLDFGFNHGGKYFIDELDFDFLWDYEFENKIYISGFNKNDNKPIFQIVQSGEVFVQGTPFIVPINHIDEFYTLMLDSMNSLLDVGFMDDDQTVMLMAYRKNKKIFKYDESSEWFSLIKNYGASHLKTMSTKSKKQNIYDKILYRYRVHKRNYKYLKGIKKIFMKDYLD